MSVKSLRVGHSDRSQRVEDRLGIASVPMGTIRQDDRDWPIRAAIVEVTPELAGIFLGTMIGGRQRNVKLAHFSSLVRDMEADRFMFTGQPLIFSEGGNLDDGQHRCRAAVKTGKTFNCLVVFGVPDSSYVALDVTAKRSGADTLRMKGIGSASAMAATAAWIYRWQSEDLITNVSLSPLEVDDIIEGHPGLIDSVVKASPASKLGAGHAFPAFCHFLFSQVDPEAADDFFRHLATDVGHEDRSPVLALRRMLLNKGRTLAKRQMIVSFFKAWNLYRKGGKIERLYATMDESIPKLI